MRKFPFFRVVGLLLFLALISSDCFAQRSSRRRANPNAPEEQFSINYNFDDLKIGDAPKLAIQIKNSYKHKVSGQIELELFDEETNRSIDEKFLNDSSLQDFEVSPEAQLTVYFPIQIPLDGPESIYYRIWFHSDSTSEHGEINKVEKGTFYIHSFEMEDIGSITESDNSIVVEKAYWTLDSIKIYTGQDLNIGDTLTFHLLLDVKKRIKELSVEFSFPACLTRLDDEYNTLTFEKLKKGRLEVFRSAIVKSAGLYNTGDGAIYKDGNVIYYMPNWEIRVRTPK